MDINRAKREYNETMLPKVLQPDYYTKGPAGMDASLIPDYTSDFELDMFLEDLEPEDLGSVPTLTAGMDDSLQSLQGQLDELDPTNPDHLDLIELLNSDMDMKYPWAQQALNLQDVIDLHKLQGLDLNTDRFIKRANKANVQVTNRGGIIGLI